jgi:hypothetical protein
MSATHSLTSTASSAPVLYVGFEVTLRWFRVELRSMEAGLDHCPWSTGSCCVGTGQEYRVRPEGDRSRQRPVPRSGERCGLLLLRGRTRRLIDLLLFIYSQHQQCDRRLVEYRGESSRPACQGRRSGRRQPGRTARSLLRRRDECVEHGQRPRSR